MRLPRSTQMPSINLKQRFTDERAVSSARPHTHVWGLTQQTDQSTIAINDHVINDRLTRGRS
jgi:hypothetical protein